jgi:hypothetical protein
MSFIIPNIHFADPSVNRPVRNGSPNVDTFKRFIDLERAIATRGKPIWGFTRSTKPGQPASPFVLTANEDVWYPFVYFPVRIPPLGSGDHNPTTGIDNLGATLWMFHGGDSPALRFRIFNPTLNTTDTKTPSETTDSNGWSRWEISNINETIAVPGSMCLLGIEFNTNTTSNNTEIWSCGLWWLDTVDITPP